MNTSWHEVLPSVGDFINKTGFPVGLWLFTGFIIYKLGKKILTKLEPLVDLYFELMTDLKNSSGRTAEILEKQNDILVQNFNVHADILNDHTNKLDEILQDTKKKVIPMSNGMAVATGASNGIKR